MHKGYRLGEFLNEELIPNEYKILIVDKINSFLIGANKLTLETGFAFTAMESPMISININNQDILDGIRNKLLKIHSWVLDDAETFSACIDVDIEWDDENRIYNAECMEFVNNINSNLAPEQAVYKVVVEK